MAILDNIAVYFVAHMRLHGTIAFVVILGYFVYQRFLHPLARFPGPFLASLTDLWQVKEHISGKQPYRLLEFHEKYGRIVRYGPDKLSISSEDALQVLYVKNNDKMPKTEFYNSFGRPGKPNLFNIRNIQLHAPRRRKILKLLSPQVVGSYEPLIDEYIRQLRYKIREHIHSNAGSPIDLKNLLWHFMCDTITQVVYGQSWGMLTGHHSKERIDVHALSLWGTASGAWSAGEPIIKLLVALVPHRWAYKVFWENLRYAINRSKMVASRAAAVEAGEGVENRDILTRMVLSRMKDDKQDKLANDDIAVELYSFLIAGIHPPATTMTLLFYNLIHNPAAMRTAVDEIRTKLPPLNESSDAYSNQRVQQSLPFLRHCLDENFRLNPVFTMPLTRRVTQDEGVVVGGYVVPQGTTVAVCNHVLHHDSNIWFEDHYTFNPHRWDSCDPRLVELRRLMMHFGAGTRQCVGKVLAVTIINKVVATLLSEFTFELDENVDRTNTQHSRSNPSLLPMESVGISDLEGELMVNVKLARHAAS